MGQFLDETIIVSYRIYLISHFRDREATSPGLSESPPGASGQCLWSLSWSVLLVWVGWRDSQHCLAGKPPAESSNPFRKRVEFSIGLVSPSFVLVLAQQFPQIEGYRVRFQMLSVQDLVVLDARPTVHQVQQSVQLPRL